MTILCWSSSASAWRQYCVRGGYADESNTEPAKQLGHPVCRATSAKSWKLQEKGRSTGAGHGLTATITAICSAVCCVVWFTDLRSGMKTAPQIPLAGSDPLGVDNVSGDGSKATLCVLARPAAWCRGHRRDPRDERRSCVTEFAHALRMQVVFAYLQNVSGRRSAASLSMNEFSPAFPQLIVWCDWPVVHCLRESQNPVVHRSIACGKSARNRRLYAVLFSYFVCALVGATAKR